MNSQKSLWEFFFFFFNDTATTEIYTLSLHDALPISVGHARNGKVIYSPRRRRRGRRRRRRRRRRRSGEHTSELQSLAYFVCRLLLEKKNYRAKRSTRLVSERGPSLR